MSQTVCEDAQPLLTGEVVPVVVVWGWGWLGVGGEYKQ